MCATFIDLYSLFSEMIQRRCRRIPPIEKVDTNINQDIRTQESGIEQGSLLPTARTEINIMNWEYLYLVTLRSSHIMNCIR